MVQFSAKLYKYDQQGEKTGWTFIEIPAAISDKLKPGCRKSFRVKGKLDNHSIKAVALLPKKGGGFIMAVNAAMRKGIGKRHGATIQVQLTEDKKPIPLSAELLECLDDEPRAKKYFESLPPSHRAYYSKWIESAKTDETRARRIVKTITALSHEKGYGEMLRSLKQEKDQLLG